MYTCNCIRKFMLVVSTSFQPKVVQSWTKSSHEVLIRDARSRWIWAVNVNKKPWLQNTVHQFRKIWLVENAQSKTQQDRNKKQFICIRLLSIDINPILLNGDLSHFCYFYFSLMLISKANRDPQTYL